jgi:hypothetical protein
MGKIFNKPTKAYDETVVGLYATVRVQTQLRSLWQENAAHGIFDIWVNSWSRTAFDCLKDCEYLGVHVYVGPRGSVRCGLTLKESMSALNKATLDECQYLRKRGRALIELYPGRPLGELCKFAQSELLGSGAS